MNATMLAWRENPEATDFDADDEQLSTTPQDVVLVLGFDPLEETATRGVVHASEPAVVATNHHLAAQDAAADRFRSAVARFLHVAEADAVRKKRRKTEDDLLLYWLMLMGEEEQDEFQRTTQRLAKHLVSGAAAPPAVSPDQSGQAAASFAESRKALLQPFAERAVEELREAAPSGISAVRKRGEEILAGEGERVATTEALATYGSAQIRLLRQAGFTHKAWATMDDDKVRPTHRQCEAQGAILIDHPFSNGLQFPGDPNGEPEETCNCRCWLTGHGRVKR